MRKKLDFSWTPTLKLVINGKLVDHKFHKVSWLSIAS